MKKLLLLLLSVLSLTAVAQQKKVAVYVVGEDKTDNKVVGNLMVTAIAQSWQFSAVERTDAILAELRKEQKYEQSGAVDDDEISRLGKQFGVHYVCVVSIFEAFNEQYLSARLIDVETAQVERTASSNKLITTLEDLTTVTNTLARDLFWYYDPKRQGNAKKVAVYVVQDQSTETIGKVLGDKIVAGLTGSGRYLAVERTSGFLKELLKEHRYQQSGEVDDNEISRLGRQFGVQYVCVTECIKAYGKYLISTRLVNVETAEVECSYDAQGEISTMNQCVKIANEIAENISKGTFKERMESFMSIDWYTFLTSRLNTYTSKSDNQWYIGNTYGEKADGYGCLYYNIGIFYIGQLSKGNFEGEGMAICFDDKELSNCDRGRYYIGSLKQCKPEGIGTVYDADGKLIYYGKFKEGQPIDTYPTPNANAYSAYTWGVIHGYIKEYKYVGELKNMKPHGKGVVIYGKGDDILWYGEWEDGKLIGNAFIIYDNGAKFRIGR